MMRLRFAALLGACAVLAGCNEKAAAPEPCLLYTSRCV